MSMKQYLLGFLVAALLLATSASSALAAIVVTQIGNDTITSQSFTEWTYTSANPVLQGTANPNETVTITIDGTATTITADSNGNWNLTPSSLAAGTHSISIVQGDSTKSFSLIIGTTPTATVAPTASVAATPTTTAGKGGGTASTSALVYPDTLPQTAGNTTSTLLILGGAFILVGSGISLQKWAHAHNE